MHSLPLYLGTQRTEGGRPLMLKCLPSNWEHCSSRKSFCPRGHGSVLQERNFIRRPTQNLPPFLGLEWEQIKDHRTATQSMLSNFSSNVCTFPLTWLAKSILVAHISMFTDALRLVQTYTAWMLNLPSVSVSYSGLLQSLAVLLVPPPQDLEHTL